MSAAIEIDLQKYKIINPIGKGAFATVYKIQKKDTDEFFAAKISKNEIDFEKSDDISNSLIEEIKILSAICHPAILKFIGFNKQNFEKEKRPTIITELSSNGSLGDLFKLQQANLADSNFDASYKHIALYGIASGMHFLHKHKIIHKDLKPDNILFDDFLFPKICDFGLSVYINDKNKKSAGRKNKLAGTYLYMPPEVIKNEDNPEFSEASDVYAFSLIAYEMFAGQPPFKSEEFYGAMKSNKRPEFDSSFPEDYKEIIEKCWKENPQERPKFEEIVQFLENDDLLQKLEDKFELDIELFDDYHEMISEFPEQFTPSNMDEVEASLRKCLTKFKKIALNYTYPLDKYFKLSQTCQEIVKRATKDPLLQYKIGIRSIEGADDFPQNYEIGINYLKNAINHKCKSAALYLSKFLISKGPFQDVAQAESYLSDCIYKNGDEYLTDADRISEDDPRVNYMYGKIRKMEENFDEAEKYFEKAAKSGNNEGMFEYGKIIYPRDPDKAIEFFEISSNDEGFEKSKNILNAYNILSKVDGFAELSGEFQIFLLKEFAKVNNNDDFNYLKKLIIDQKTLKKFYKKNVFQHNSLSTILSKFQEIYIGLEFNSDIYESAIESIQKIKNELKGKETIITVVVTISDRYKTIEKEFGSNSVVNVATIKGKVQSIGNLVFADCKALKNVSIPISVTSIGESAFENCKSLTNIPLISITEIKKRTFYQCESIPSISMPEIVQSIGDFAFYKCTNLQTLAIPKNTRTIGNSSFEECTSLDSVVLNVNLNTIGNNAFRGCINIKKISIPKNVLSIGERSFANCESLKTVTFSKKMTTIAKAAFENCQELKKLKNLVNIQVIESHAFHDCTSLKQIDLSNVERIRSSAFHGCSSLESVNITNVYHIGNGTFKGCTSLKEIKLPECLKEIGSSAFEGCSLIEDIEIPEKVTSISEAAFAECENLRSIKLPCSIKEIMDNCFFNCCNLTEITLHEGILVIGKSVFVGCTSLKKIVIPGSVTKIDESCFEDCLSLEEIIIPKSVKSIEKGAFSNCKKLEELELPEAIETISEKMFYNCSSLKKIKIPDSVRSIENNAFEECVLIKRIDIPNVVSIGENSFKGCTSLEMIVLNESLEKLGGFAFSKCSSLREFPLPENITKIEPGLL